VKELVIHPITRIEGHLSVRVLLEKDRVVDAWVQGTMFRGFEIILIGRNPVDAQFITSRICGVCSLDHSIATARALEDAFNVQPPPIAIVVRNIMQYTHWIYDHILHCMLLAGPDYGPPYGKIEDLAWLKGKGFIEALKMQKLAMEAAAIFAGKLPHAASILPGGISDIIDIQKIMSFMYRVKQLKTWIDNYMIPLFDKLYEVYKDEMQYSGEREANLIAYGTFEDISLDPLKRALKPGVIIKGSLITNNLYDEIEPNIIEHVTHSWYTEDSGGKPSEEGPPKVTFTGMNKNHKYSYIKAPRWKEYVVETGPLARMWSTALQCGGKVRTDAGDWRPPKKPNTLERIYARAYETAFAATKVLEEIDKLLDLFKEGNRDPWNPWEIPESSKGRGLVEAARGALGHWIRIKKYVIDGYQVITPTAWNASPRDDKGRKGPLEEALTNTPIVTKTDPTLDIVRVVRAFDPCLACAVHAYRGNEKIVETILPTTRIKL